MQVRRAVCFGLLFVLPPRLKPLALRLLCGAQVGRHVSIGWFASVAGRHVRLGDYATVAALTVIRCDGEIALGAYSQISSFTLVYGSASFIVGDHSYVGPQSLINADEDVRLGHHTALGARAMVYTHGSWLPYTEGYWVRFGAVTVGDHVWCAAGVFLHPGVTIGDHVFVNSRSVVASDIAGNTVAEGAPAQPVARMDQLRRKMSPRKVDAAIQDMLHHFVRVEVGRIRGAEAVAEGSGAWRVPTPSGPVLVVTVPSEPLDVPPSVPAGTRAVYLSNQPGWAGGLDPSTPVIDFTRSTARTAGNELCQTLVEFLKRYYGVQLEFDDRER
jgi:acetyltransferase-like isoleucine patch superfamily enzyme